MDYHSKQNNQLVQEFKETSVEILTDFSRICECQIELTKTLIKRHKQLAYRAGLIFSLCILSLSVLITSFLQYIGYQAQQSLNLKPVIVQSIILTTLLIITLLLAYLFIRNIQMMKQVPIRITGSWIQQWRWLKSLKQK